MIKNLITTAIAFLVGVLVTHTYWYRVNKRLQATHQRNLDDCFNHTYEKAYRDGYSRRAHEAVGSPCCDDPKL